MKRTTHCRGRDVEVHVAVPDVTVSDHSGHRAPEPLPHHRDRVVEDGERQRDVVLVAVPVLQQSLRDPLPQLPDLRLLGGSRGHGPVLHHPGLHHLLQEGVELGLVVLLVTAAGLDQHVELVVCQRTGELEVGGHTLHRARV